MRFHDPVMSKIDLEKILKRTALFERVRKSSCFSACETKRVYHLVRSSALTAVVGKVASINIERV